MTKTAAEDLCELVARDHGLPCLILRTSRFFPEADDRDDVRSAYDDLNIKVNELLYRRVDIEDVVSAHLLALERAPAIGFGRYIISATTPFTPRRPAPRSDTTCRASCARLFPDYEELYAQRGWRMFPSIERVYVNERARRELGWAPRYDFRYALDRLARRRRPAQRARPQHRRQGLPRGLDRRLHGALNLDHRWADVARRVADYVGRADRVGSAARAVLVAGVHERQRPAAALDRSPSAATSVRPTL